MNEGKVTIELTPDQAEVLLACVGLDIWRYQKLRDAETSEVLRRTGDNIVSVFDGIKRQIERSLNKS